MLYRCYRRPAIVTPAEWLGLSRTHGTIESGKVANLVVSEGDLFAEEATVRDVWVQGRVYEVTRPTQIDPRGTWRIASSDEWGFDAVLTLEGPLNRLQGSIEVAEPGSPGAQIDLASASVVAETGRVEVRFDTGEARRGTFRAPARSAGCRSLT